MVVDLNILNLFKKILERTICGSWFKYIEFIEENIWKEQFVVVDIIKSIFTTNLVLNRIY